MEKKNQFINKIKDLGGFSDKESAEAATFIVFNLLRYRITENEAEHVESQLPQDLKELWNSDNQVENFFRRLTNLPMIKYKDDTQLLNLVESELKDCGITVSAEKTITQYFMS